MFVLLKSEVLAFPMDLHLLIFPSVMHIQFITCFQKPPTFFFSCTSLLRYAYDVQEVAQSMMDGIENDGLAVDGRNLFFEYSMFQESMEKFLLQMKPFSIIRGSLNGTGAWQSALTNTLSPGDQIVSFLIGQFSLLWIDQQQRLNFNVDVIESDWGQGGNLDFLAAKLAADKSHSIKAICIVHNETATGVTNDLAAVRKLLDTLLCS